MASSNLNLIPKSKIAIEPLSQDVEAALKSRYPGAMVEVRMNTPHQIYVIISSPDASKVPNPLIVNQGNVRINNIEYSVKVDGGTSDGSATGL